MTNWNTLKHAYGKAADIPALLAAISPDSESDAWYDLWSRLCHQGTVYAASFAALPTLLELATTWNPRERGQVLTMASSILISDDVHGGDREEFRGPVEWVIPRFQELCRESLAETEWPSTDFIYLLQAMRALEGDAFWGQELDHLADGEFSGVYPHCAVDLYVVIGGYGFFTTDEE